MTRRESDDLATERTPLLPSSAAHTAPEARSTVTANGAFHTPLDDAALSKSIKSPRKRRWATLIALILLCLIGIAVLVMGFFVPAAAEQYAREAVTVNVSSLSIESFTSRGVQARVKAKVHVDASRVKNKFVRNIGRLGTAIAKKVSTEEGELHVFLLDYDNALLGNASIPPMVIDIRNGHSNFYDFISTVEPVSLDTAQKVVEDYIDGKLKSLEVMGSTRITMRSGILPLGNQLLTDTMKLEALPSLPQYNVTNLEFHEEDGAVAVSISATVPNPYTFKLNLPSLGFGISLPGCDKELIPIATAVTPEYLVEPKIDINIAINGIVDNLPDALTTACPGTDRSSMDDFLGSYLHGDNSLVYVRGGGHQKGSEAPKWLSNFLKAITIPASFPGHKHDNMVEDLGLSRVRFELPNSHAKPGTPEAAPKLSAVVDAMVALPKEMNFPIGVKGLKASANLSYHGEKFGEMHMTEWQPALSHLTDDEKLAVRAEIFQAPLDITDYEILKTVVQRLVWGGGRGLVLGIDGFTDVKMETTLGNFAVRGIPANGDVTIKGLPFIPDFAPKANFMEVLTTTKESMTLQIGLLVENPTEYSAHIPYLAVHLEKDEFIIGNASISNTNITPGNNSIIVKATYAPVGEGRDGTKHAIEKGLELLGEYVSGKNTTLEVKAFEGSIPGLPELSRALSGLGATLPIPRPQPPPSQHDPDGPSSPPEDQPPSTSPFLQGATMHIFSSSATFLLYNPFPKTPITIYDLNGKAFYNCSKLGSVCYDGEWEILAGREAGEGGLSLSPRLPVKWVFGGAAYSAMVDALGGPLRIDTSANATVGVGEWRGRVQFEGGGLKVGIRL
ncbi:hypothetical protein EV426DRAFT_568186 [Tirmania nivea]|nr:hypothetical protein EV426DRAFT_568186 [Tirmania nivea]